MRLPKQRGISSFTLGFFRENKFGERLADSFQNAFAGVDFVPQNQSTPASSPPPHHHNK
jgi:hypothetical protein